ncbi:MAG: hypothetical protein EOO59_20325, partial [Hymenobacter sp.]
MPIALAKPSKKTVAPQKSAAPKATDSTSSPAKKPTPVAPIAAPVREGFGALPHSAGTTFRVWAPNATAVSVIGAFNNWDKNANPLRAEDDGNWAADLPRAKPGDEYKFVLQTPWGERTRNDPYARAMT